MLKWHQLTTVFCGHCIAVEAANHARILPPTPTCTPIFRRVTYLHFEAKSLFFSLHILCRIFLGSYWYCTTALSDFPQTLSYTSEATLSVRYRCRRQVVGEPESRGGNSSWKCRLLDSIFGGTHPLPPLIFYALVMYRAESCVFRYSKRLFRYGSLKQTCSISGYIVSGP